MVCSRRKVFDHKEYLYRESLKWTTIYGWYIVGGGLVHDLQCPHFPDKKCKILTKSGPKLKENQNKSLPNLILLHTSFTKNRLNWTLCQF